MELATKMMTVVFSLSDTTDTVIQFSYQVLFSIFNGTT